ncbi:M12 family metallopeptidase [Shewanella inventionis]|nr:M12 family metallopeptidase [Shewanella inventionis]MCL1160253.1 M12 family metallopeptidase [Shewanella inventionis]GGB52205.1 hypothetical protein GCM10011607_10870 [Shewanella inventionis]
MKLFNYLILSSCITLSLNSHSKTYDILVEGADENNVLVHKTLTVERSKGEYIFEGDIIVTEHIETLNTPTPYSVIISGSQYRWDLGVIPYTISTNYSTSQINSILQAMSDIEDVSGVIFVERSNQADYISIYKGSGCSSQVGKRGGSQNVSLADGCFSGGTPTHELLHAAGFWHEQSREDRDSYITINWENIISGKEHNFEQHISDGEDVGPYDYNSIMHYHSTAFSSNGQATISRNDGMSSLGGSVMTSTDISTLREMYGYLQEVDLNVNYHYCYGENSLNWASYNDDADYYEIQINSGYAFSNFATTTNKAYQVSVNQNTEFRV